MNLRKTLKGLAGEVLYRIKPGRVTSVRNAIAGETFGNPGPGDLAIDCGANEGLVTEVLAAGGAEVHAFEPNPDAFRRLRERFAQVPHVHLHEQAVLDREDTMRLHFHLNYDRNPQRFSAGSSLIAEKRNVSERRGVEVKVIDLAAFIETLERPVKVLKLDIEGAEYVVLEKLIESGMIERIERVLVETHAHAIPSLVEADASLRRRIREAGLEGQINLNWV